MNYDTVLPGRIRARFEHKRSRNPFKWIAIGLTAVFLLCVGVWLVDRYQTMQAKAEYLQYAVAHHKPFEQALLEWGKIQYLKTHAVLPEPPEYAGYIPVNGDATTMATAERYDEIRAANTALRKQYNQQFLK